MMQFNRPWTLAHIAMMHFNWNSLDESNHLFTYNREIYLRAFKDQPVDALEYFSGLDIRHFSQWAQAVLQEHGIL